MTPQAAVEAQYEYRARVIAAELAAAFDALMQWMVFTAKVLSEEESGRLY